MYVMIIGVMVYLYCCQVYCVLELYLIVSYFFCFWLWMIIGMLIGQWVVIYCKYYVKCEIEEDLYSLQMCGIWKVFFEGVELYCVEVKNEEMMCKFSYGMLNDWIECNFYLKYLIFGVSLMMVIDVVLFGVFGLIVWVVQMVWILFWVVGVVNGFGYFWGYCNFNLVDVSMNLFLWGIVIGGEELYNNYYMFVMLVKLLNKWYEFDIGWMYICIMLVFGFVKVKKVVLMLCLNKLKMVFDQEMLQVVLLNCYEVMVSYGKVVKCVYCQEFVYLKEFGLSEKYQLMCGVCKWFYKDVDGFDELQKKLLLEIFVNSQKLYMYFQLCQDLVVIWDCLIVLCEQFFV